MIPKNDAEAIRLILVGVIKAGYVPVQVNTGDGYESVKHAATVTDLVEKCTEADAAVLDVAHPQKGSSFLYFVLGNEPIEVLCDHGVSLSEVVDPITDPWW